MMPDRLIPILFADDEILVVSKPANVLSVPGKGPEKQDCLVSRLHEQGFNTARIVHRLDYATSGIMVLGLTADSHKQLSIQFQERKTHKRYEAIVTGTPSTPQGSVNLPLRCDWERRPLQMVDFEQGKPALTHWSVLENINDYSIPASRIDLEPVTGRSHQLRVHSRAIGHAILGDEFYAEGESLNAADRLLLHAKALSFYHPANQAWLEFTEQPPF
jgi:tRNA pseudouridine32 synthase/23S rRNA pseudouridine746 synthase